MNNNDIIKTKIQITQIVMLLEEISSILKVKQQQEERKLPRQI